jgi:lipopolysaccharide biosynthesis glycosyltransferase
MATEHANARFFVPLLARHGWAMFTDGDVLFRGDVAPLFDSLQPDYAVYCVKHNHQPIGQVKMDGQVQTRYNRKNWSSFMIFNCDHPSNKVLHDPKAIINSLPGRDLHAFCWLKDEEIGAMSYEWNYLEGFTSGVSDPKMVHFTEGVPDMAGYENAEYAEEWFAERRRLGRSPAAD